MIHNMWKQPVHWASRVQTDESLDERQQIATAFRWLTSRMPEELELDGLVDLFREQLAEFEQDPSGARNLVSVGISPLRRNVEIISLAAMTIVTSTIMNLDEAQH